MLAEAFQEFFILDGGAHRLMVRRPASLELPDALQAVKDVANTKELEVKSWRELSPILATMIDSALQMLQIGFLVIYVAVIILLLNAMLMAVFERVREFGILKAIGVSPGSVMRLILMEGIIQTAIAILLGCLLSLPALWYLVDVGIDLGELGGTTVMGMVIDPNIYGIISYQTFTMPLIILLIVVVLGILYPAIKAAKITPIEAIYHQ
jgi:ABC-type lipoprotein release transport system permease subunit